jgi:hypothetical protein
MTTHKPLADLPAWTLDQLTAAPPADETKASQNGHSAPQPPADAADTGAYWLGKGLDKVAAGEYRNETGLWLACQLRDAGMAENDAALWMEVYTLRVPRGDDPYTDSEAQSSLRSAYGRPAREPAKGTEKSYSKNAQNNLQPADEDSNIAFFEYVPDEFPTADDAMFYGTAGAIVKAIAPHTEASPVALLVQFLACFGNAAGRHVHYLAEADKHFANLFVLIVGDTAKARKGVSWGHTARVYRAAAPAWLDLHTISGLSSGEGIVHALCDVAAPDIPVGDEGELLRDKRLLAREGEFAGVLGQQKRDGNNLSMVLRDGWDGVPLGTFTKNSPERATDAHLSVIGHITQEELVKRMTSTDAVNGFANRFLYVSTKRAGLLPHGGDLDAIERAVKPHLDALRAALEWAKTPRRLAHDKEAYDLWECDSVYKRLSTGHPGLFGAVTARAEAQVSRIALVHAMLDRSHAVTAAHLRAALALWQFCEDSARYIFGDKLGDSVADGILDALRATADGLTRTELYEQFGHNVPSAKISAALVLLLKLGLARMEKENTGGKGRPVERWYATQKRTQETH